MRDHVFNSRQRAHSALVVLLDRVVWGYDVTVTLRSTYSPVCPVCGFRGDYARGDDGFRSSNPTYRVCASTAKLICRACGFSPMSSWKTLEACPACREDISDIPLDDYVTGRGRSRRQRVGRRNWSFCHFCSFELPEGRIVSSQAAVARWRRAWKAVRLKRLEWRRVNWVMCTERGGLFGRLHYHLLLAGPADVCQRVHSAFVRKCGFVSWRAISPLAEAQKIAVQNYAVKHAIKGVEDSRVPGALGGINFSPSFPRFDGSSDLPGVAVFPEAVR